MTDSPRDFQDKMLGQIFVPFSLPFISPPILSFTIVKKPRRLSVSLAGWNINFWTHLIQYLAQFSI